MCSVLASGEVGAVASIRLPGRGGGEEQGSLCLVPDPVHPDCSWRVKLGPGWEGMRPGRWEGVRHCSGLSSTTWGAAAGSQALSLRCGWRGQPLLRPPQSRCITPHLLPKMFRMISFGCVLQLPAPRPQGWPPPGTMDPLNIKTGGWWGNSLLASMGADC